MEQETEFTFTSADGTLTCVGHFADGHWAGETGINLTDASGIRMLLKTERIVSIVTSKRNITPANAPCYDEKAVVTLDGGTVVEGCFRPYKVNFASDVLNLDLNSAIGTFLRKRD